MRGRVKAQIKRLAMAMLRTNMLLANLHLLLDRITRTTNRFPISPNTDRSRVATCSRKNVNIPVLKQIIFP